ncbi:hypothetical protein Trydic_g6008 [Trypoxylus dichotomus]
MKAGRHESTIVKEFLECNLYLQNILVYETIILKTILDNTKAYIYNYVNSERKIIESNGVNLKKSKTKRKLTLQETLKLARACNKKPLPKKCLLRRAKKATMY